MNHHMSHFQYGLNKKMSKFFSIGVFLTILFFSTYSFSENLGVYGQVYTIAEPDLLTFIHDRLLQFKQDGRLKKMQVNFENKVAQHVIRPTPVAGVSNASSDSKTKIFYYTPNFTLQQNIYDMNGKLLFPAGTQINPLNKKQVAAVAPQAVIPQFNETLIFINADSTSQVAWTKKQIKLIKGIYKIILVKGNLKTASDALGRIYFDQDGVLCHQFGINRVPAILTRASNRLKIIESPV